MLSFSVLQIHLQGVVSGPVGVGGGALTMDHGPGLALGCGKARCRNDVVS